MLSLAQTCCLDIREKNRAEKYSKLKVKARKVRSPGCQKSVQKALFESQFDPSLISMLAVGKNLLHRRQGHLVLRSCFVPTTSKIRDVMTRTTAVGLKLEMV